MTEAFLERHPEETAIMYQMLEFQGRHLKGVLEGHEAYLYGSLDGIRGLMIFTAHEHLLIVSEEEGLIGKYDFLKLIKTQRPKWIKGDPASVKQVMKISRTFARILETNDVFVMLTNREVEIGTGYCTLPEALNLKSAAALMLRVEKAFSHNTSSINRLKQRIVQRVSEGDQYFAEVDGEIVAHGAIEFLTPQYAMLGGIYVDPAARGKGCGAYISRILMSRAQERDLIPMLCVYADNQPAIHLYESLGFETAARLLETHLDYE
jgi:ribosomal protein S18 acetylase RimI-like enzyme